MQRKGTSEEQTQSAEGKGVLHTFKERKIVVSGQVIKDGEGCV